jgi:hypothetical protein
VNPLKHSGLYCSVLVTAEGIQLGRVYDSLQNRLSLKPNPLEVVTICANVGNDMLSILQEIILKFLFNSFYSSFSITHSRYKTRVIPKIIDNMK